jgi:hypothetical protein
MKTSDSNADRKQPKWTVHRQDDNGNRFVVESGLSREEAERLVQVFEARGHKQLYWAEIEPEQEGC